MKPIYKWTGGKRKEIDIIREYTPQYIKEEKEYTFIEPFFGGGAVYWNLENNDNIINDVDTEVINFLNTIKSNPNEVSKVLDQLSKDIAIITTREKNEELSISEAKTERGKYFYEWRNKDRDGGMTNLSEIERAIRFYIVNQLSFNGMRRFNNKGEFNVPYGNYKTFNRQYTEDHISLLHNTTINCGDYRDIIKKTDKDTFVFIDPPYTREFNEYSHGNSFGNKEQMELCDLFKSSDCDIMIVINKDDFTTELYDGYIKDVYELKYSTNIKNRFSNTVEHLMITNY